MTRPPSQRPLDYEPSRPPRGPDRLFSLATAGLVLGAINLFWSAVATGIASLEPSLGGDVLVTIIACGIVPSAVIGVILAFAGARDAHRWLIFGLNAAALLLVTFLLLWPW